MQDFLAQRFNPNHNTGLDACIRVDWGDGGIQFAVRETQLDLKCSDRPEMTLYFESESLARQLLSGESDLISAFMQNKFRASGHLIWVFHTMTAFRPTQT